MIEAARPAEAADLPALDALHRQATEELRAQRGGPLWARHTARGSNLALDLDPDAPGELVLAGTIDDVVVGYARVVLEPIEGGDQLAVLTDVYVESEARGVGIGALLLDAAIDWSREQGAVGIDSIALPGMRDTKNFFEAAGMVARAIIVHKSFVAPVVPS